VAVASRCCEGTTRAGTALPPYHADARRRTPMPTRASAPLGGPLRHCLKLWARPPARGLRPELAHAGGGVIMSGMILTYQLRRIGWLAAVALWLGLGFVAAGETPQLHNTLPPDGSADSPQLHNSLSAGATAQSHNALADNEEDDFEPPPAIDNAVTITANQAPFEKVLDDIRAQCHLNFDINWNALQNAGVDRNTPVTVNLPNPVPAARALNTVLSTVSSSPTSLGWTGLNGLIHISTREELNSAKYQTVQIYDVIDLVGQPLGNGDYKISDDVVRNLTTIITATVAPDTWRDTGGTIGAIREFNGMLIITQITEHHREIRNLLARIRAVQNARK
jgi:hypothetical protein